MTTFAPGLIVSREFVQMSIVNSQKTALLKVGSCNSPLTPKVLKYPKQEDTLQGAVNVSAHIAIGIWIGRVRAEGQI